MLCFISSELAAICNNHRLRGLPGAGPHFLNLLHHLHSFNHLTKNNMFPIKPLRLRSADKKLRSIRPGTRIRHGKNSRTGVRLDEILIGELGSINGLSSGSVSSREVTTLAHEIRDHTVEGRAFVMKRLPASADSFLAGAECTEVISGERSGISVKLHDNTARGLASDGHIEENFRVGHFFGG
ncbi:hypothetical protein KIW84_050075 [Lathyrus oleraceus]|uniref:Uncharacterized protein n=1 Tax=Pisum sativum TaxID=3888 RepID=A0A9D5A8X9_PEA|nr:hypothetical protein KIW84_050075 [Pisum sativum]